MRSCICLKPGLVLKSSQCGTKGQRSPRTQACLPEVLFAFADYDTYSSVSTSQVPQTDHRASGSLHKHPGSRDSDEGGQS